MPASYTAAQILGTGTALSDVLGPNPSRRQASVRNLGPGPVWLGDRDMEDPSTGRGVRVLPGESITFASPSAVYSITWAGNTYRLETWDESP